MAELEALHKDVRNADSHPIGFTLPFAQLPDPTTIAEGVAAYDPETGILYVCSGTEWVAKAGPHTHDDRYFTEDEVTALLAGKSDAEHSHGWAAITGKPATFPPDAHEHAWGAITDKPATFPAEPHTHDDRYFTETEINTALAGKSDTGHGHAWDTITGKPATFPPDAHTHDDRYFTEAEITALLGGKEAALGNPAVDGYVLSSTTAGVRSWIAPPAGTGGGLANVVEDTTPQLGGDLDTNGHQIVSAPVNLGTKTDSFDIDWSLGREFTVTISGTIPNMTFSNVQAGMKMILYIVQATGGDTITNWPTQCRYGGSIGNTQPTLSGGPNFMDQFGFSAYSSTLVMVAIYDWGYDIS